MMKLNIVLVASFVTLLAGMWLSQPSAAHAQGRTDGIRVSATAYTCDVHPRNPMSGCVRTRWGGRNVNNPGMACPVSWRNRHYVVEGFGTLRCDDTGRYDTWNGLPHIDIRMETWEATRAWGVRTITIYPSDRQAASGSTASASAPAAPAANAGATGAAGTTAATVQQPLAAAKSAVPKGDTSTAVMRRTTLDAAASTLPWLGEVARVSRSHPLWLVTLWQPREILPSDATALPNRDEPIATTLVIVDGSTGAVLGQTHITVHALNAIGSLP